MCVSNSWINAPYIQVNQIKIIYVDFPVSGKCKGFTFAKLTSRATKCDIFKRTRYFIRKKTIV